MEVTFGVMINVSRKLLLNVTMPNYGDLLAGMMTLVPSSVGMPAKKWIKINLSLTVVVLFLFNSVNIFVKYFFHYFSTIFMKTSSAKK